MLPPLQPEPAPLHVLIADEDASIRRACCEIAASEGMVAHETELSSRARGTAAGQGRRHCAGGRDDRDRRGMRGAGRAAADASGCCGGVDDGGVDGAAGAGGFALRRERLSHQAVFRRRAGVGAAAFGGAENASMRPAGDCGSGCARAGVTAIFWARARRWKSCTGSSRGWRRPCIRC